MPDGRTLGIDPCHVIYVTAEDSSDQVAASFKLFGGKLDLLTILATGQQTDAQLNVLDNLQELESKIKETRCRLVIIDGQNSVVGAPDIGTDMKGRHNVSNKLHSFAQRLNIALVGIRNEDSTGRALGSQSMGDIARVVMRVEEIPVKKEGKPRKFKLEFVKVSDTAKANYPPIHYMVQDLGGADRKILWGKGAPVDKKKIVEQLTNGLKKPNSTKKKPKTSTANKPVAKKSKATKQKIQIKRKPAKNRT